MNVLIGKSAHQAYITNGKPGDQALLCGTEVSFDVLEKCHYTRLDAAQVLRLIDSRQVKEPESIALYFSHAVYDCKIK